MQRKNASESVAEGKRVRLGLMKPCKNFGDSMYPNIFFLTGTITIKFVKKSPFNQTYAMN